MPRAWIAGGWTLTSRTLHITTAGLRSPVLVPSISSKGFPVLDDGTSETANVLKFVAPELSDSLLISAYDLHHGFLPDIELLLSDRHAESLYFNPNLLVVDSGGYELSHEYESGEVGRGPRSPRRFTREEHHAILDRLPKDREILAVTYDDQRKKRPTYEEQLAAAQDLTVDFPHFSVDFLVKPAREAQCIDPAKLFPVLPDLRKFAVVGFTEKDLGKTIIERLTTVVTLRKQMDDAGLAGIPIHIFGGLDPLLTSLYFMCGAEIFDGLSWLRYAYHSGVAIHEAEIAILTNAIDVGDDLRAARRHLANLKYLHDFQHRLERWAADPASFELLGDHHERLREVYELVHARLQGGA